MIKGKSGNGKSTLCKLLNRSLELENGEIYIGDKNIKDYSLKTIRNNIVYVGQKEFLYTDTIKNNILFYNDEEGNTKVEVILENEDVWLNTEALAALFNVKRPAITKHINNIYNDQELEKGSTCSKMEHMGNDGKQTYNTKYYNLNIII